MGDEVSPREVDVTFYINPRCFWANPAEYLNILFPAKRGSLGTPQPVNH